MTTENTSFEKIQNDDATRSKVRERYGSLARGGSSCCGPEPAADTCGGDPPNPAAVKADRLGYSADEQAVSPEGADLGLGCGNPTAIAALKPGETVLDLGSGGGFDCFIAARQVGPTGSVIGVDMTPDMVSTARANAAKGDFANVQFRLGEIEALPLADGTVDVILSNCVINLSPDKAAVFREAFRVLKPGGRLSIADIVATAPIPDELAADFEAITGCVAGAAPVEAIESMLRDAGFDDIAITLKEESRAYINNWTASGRAGDYVVSATIEAVKPA
ncbi:MAG: arsenite methyltransferase [Opitutales bacterium]